MFKVMRKKTLNTLISEEKEREYRRGWNDGYQKGVEAGETDLLKKQVLENKLRKQQEEMLKHFPLGARFKCLGIEYLSAGVEKVSYGEYVELWGQYINTKYEVSVRKFPWSMLAVLLKENEPKPAV